MRVACLSDQHGYLPEIPQNVDLLILAGDYVFTKKGDWSRQLRFINGPFHQWIEEIASRMEIIIVAGNHDEVFEKHYRLINPFPENVHYLENSGVTINGLKIWGSPENLFFFNWSFNRRPAEIRKYWEAIPSDTDILVCHQPMYGIADLVPKMNPGEDESIFDGEHVGCHYLRDRIMEIQPKLFVAGHIHGGYGIHKLNETIVVGASHLDDDYKNPREIIIVDL